MFRVAEVEGDLWQRGRGGYEEERDGIQPRLCNILRLPIRKTGRAGTVPGG